jgi:voltage-gated potassium channel
LLYLTEAGFSGAQGPFSDYFESYWNVIIVIISGIEDKEPVSLLGRIEITLMLIAGVVFVGFVTGEIVSVLVHRWQRGGLITLMPPRTRLQNHIVILGVNNRLQNVIRETDAALEGTHFFVIVDETADALPAPNASICRRVFAIAGTPSDKQVLDQVCIDQAARILILAREVPGDTSEDRDSRSLIVTLAATLRERATHIPTVVEICDQENLSYAKNLPHVDFVVGKMFGESLISQAVLNPGVTRIYDELLNFTDESNEIYIVPTPRFLIGESVNRARLVCLDLEKDPMTLIGVQSRGDGGGPRTVWCGSGPGAMSRKLDDNDRLIVLAEKRPKFGRTAEDTWSATFLERS